jgi:hypothetical protein
MNGVEILSSEVIYETEVWWPMFFIVIGISAVVGCLINVFTNTSPDLIDGLLGAVIGMIIGILFGPLMTMLTTHTTDQVEYIEYKVTIDDSVSMNEFLDKYEILDQEGKIYTVKERE